MTTETKHMPSEREIEAVNVESLRLIAEEFRKLEAPYKDRGDPRGLGLGARAYCVECAADEIERARATSQSRTPDQEITVRDGKWAQKKVSCRQLAEWISEQATSDRDGLIQRVAEAIEEDRKITRARVPDQSERVKELEAELSLANDAMQATALRAADEIIALRAALAEARKVIEPFANEAPRYDEIPGVLLIHDDVELWQRANTHTKICVGNLRAARDWRTRNSESSK